MTLDLKAMRERCENYPETFTRANRVGGPTDYPARYSLDYLHSEFARDLPALLDWVERAAEILRVYDALLNRRGFMLGLRGDSTEQLRSQKLLAEIEDGKK